METIKNLTDRLEEIVKASETAQGDDLAKLFTEAGEIKATLEAANTRKQLFEIASNVTKAQIEKPEDVNKAATERVNTLKSGGAVNYGLGDVLNKSITIAAANNLILPQHARSTITDNFAGVSNLINLFQSEYLEGGESYKVPFLKDSPEGTITAEGAVPTETLPTFGFATMNKIKITAYGYISEEAVKLPAANYEAKVIAEMDKAVKRKIIEQSIAGTGTNQFTGIFAAPEAIRAAKDISLAAIDENTLETLVLAYGGDEDVMQGYLILNKSTLLEFAKIKGTDKKPAYNIDYVNRTINGVPYVICSKVTPFATATAGKFVLAYGEPFNYDVTFFSGIEIKKSEDYKFGEGMITYKASTFAGGNVVKYDGFVRVKKS